jgi:hypothetical protein
MVNMIGLMQENNDATFWNHVCIIFTKCDAGCQEIDKPVKQQKYRHLILKLVRECQV